MPIVPRHVLPLIVLAQFCCTSLWFAGNAVIPELVDAFVLPTTALGSLTSAIQFGFICGTLVFAVLAIADRFSPSRVFLVSALVAAGCNLAVTAAGNTLFSLLTGRFITGFFLAGIYPVGMKIAADYYRLGLGKSLGFLVGALVLGTAFPHLLRSLSETLPWRNIFWLTSGLAVLGGVLIAFFIPDGPHRTANRKADFSTFFRVFAHRPFRAAAFGYFGHMWELYAFWAFVPVLLRASLALHPGADFNVSRWSFIVIGAGALGCVAGGYLAQRFGARAVAAAALTMSGVCCLLSPWCFTLPPEVFLAFLVFWGMVVVADSPLFSTLVAGSAPAEQRGTALTIVNCLGFAITIISIQLLGNMIVAYGPAWSMLVLAIGPVLGLAGLLMGDKLGAAAGAVES